MTFPFSTFYGFIILLPLIFSCTSPLLVWTLQSWLIHSGVVGAAVIATLWCKWDNSFTIRPIGIYFKAPEKKSLGEPAAVWVLPSSRTGRSRHPDLPLQGKIKLFSPWEKQTNCVMPNKGFWCGPSSPVALQAYPLFCFQPSQPKSEVLKMLPALPFPGRTIRPVQNAHPISHLYCRLQSFPPS